HDRGVTEISDIAIEVATFPFAMRSEAEEGEGKGSDAAGDEGHDAGEWTGDRFDDDAALARDAHDAKAGIGNERHAGVADERDRLAMLDAVDECFCARVF